MTGNAMEYCRDFFDWDFYFVCADEIAIDPVNAGKLTADGKMVKIRRSTNKAYNASS